MNELQSPFTIVFLVNAPIYTGAKFGVIRLPLGESDIEVLWQSLSLRLSIPVSKEYCREGVVSLEIDSFKDFRPHVLAKKVSFLSHLEEAKNSIEEGQKTGKSASEMARFIEERWPELHLNLAVSESAPLQPAASKDTSSALDDIFSMVAVSDSPVSRPNPRPGGVSDWLGQIESIQAAILTEIYGSSQFRQAESFAQGLRLVLKQGLDKDGFPVQIDLCPFNTLSLGSMLDNLVEHYADSLPNCILIDIPFGSTTADFEEMKKLAEFSDSFLVPTAFWVTPRFFHVDTWAGLNKISYLKHYFDDMSYAKWRSLREHSGSQWLVQCCNRFLVRPPYGEENKPRGTYFRESGPPWVSPIWALGTLISQSISRYGWPSRLTDYKTVFIENLSVHYISDESGCASEALISEDRADQLIEMGIMPIMGSKGSDRIFLFREGTLSGQSLKFQFFFNRIVACLLDLKQRSAESLDDGTVCDIVKEALMKLFQQTGQAVPEDLDVSIGACHEGGMRPVHISFTPPARVVTTKHLFEFSLGW